MLNVNDLARGSGVEVKKEREREREVRKEKECLEGVIHIPSPVSVCLCAWGPEEQAVFTPHQDTQRV